MFDKKKIDSQTQPAKKDNERRPNTLWQLKTIAPKTKISETIDG